MKLSFSNHRSGLTLVELLVVVTIMVLLMGVVLPLAGPSLRGREVREAARQVSAFLASAQADAIASGQPVGIELIPSANDSSRCFQLAKVKMPPTVSDVGFVARFKPDVPTQTFRELEFVFTGPTGSSVAFPPLLTSVLLRAAKSSPQPNQNALVSFEIRFGYRGKTFVGTYSWNGTETPNDDQFVITRDQFANGGIDAALPKGTQPSPPLSPNGIRFQVNAPPRRTLASRLNLPSGAYIDLVSSGFTAHRPFTALTPDPTLFEGSFYLGLGYVNTTPPNPPLETAKIMFAPNGQLSHFYGGIVFPGTPADANRNRPIGVQPANPIMILLSNAKRGAAPNQTSVELSKALLPAEAGIWVSVSPVGKISTTPNLGFDVSAINANDPSQFRFALQDARSKIRSSVEMGGR